MASYIEPKFYTLKAGADLSAKQFHFAKFGADEDHAIACAVAGEKGIGVIMNAPDAAELPVELAIFGGAKVKIAATIAAGDELMCDANGAGVVATTTKKVLAIAMNAGVTGDVIGVKLVNYELN